MDVWTGPDVSRKLRFPDFKTIVTLRRQVFQPYARLPLPAGNIPGTHFSQSLFRIQGHSAARKIMSMKNSHDPIGNRNRDVPACSAVHQPTESRRGFTHAVILDWDTGRKAGECRFTAGNVLVLGNMIASMCSLDNRRELDEALGLTQKLLAWLCRIVEMWWQLFV